MDTSGFTPKETAANYEKNGFPLSLSDAEPLNIGGSTCDCYRIRIYGKLHFLKRLKSELRTDPRYVAAIQKEFETGYSLDHPLLPRYVSHGDDYVLMEYIDGETLEQFCNSHPDYFSNSRNADRFLQQLCSVLEYLHIRHVLHLDLKPQNIIITRIGNDVRLVDFGYSHTDLYPDTPGHTDKYAAPEQLISNDTGYSAESGKVDARTDIYAVGKILSTLPCARKYKNLIAKCTKTNPADRFQNIGELQDFMKRKRRSLPAAIFASLLVITSVALITILFVSKPMPAEGKGMAEKTDSIVPAAVIEDSVAARQKTGNAQAKPLPMPQQDETLPNSNEKKAVPKSKNTASLNKELKETLKPLFERYFSSYYGKSYYELEVVELEEFGKTHAAFSNDATQTAQKLWKNRYAPNASGSQAGSIDEYTFWGEFEKVCNDLDQQLFKR